MPFDSFYKTDLLGVPKETDQSMMNTVLAHGARLSYDGFRDLGKALGDKKARKEQLKEGQQDRADKMAKTSTFFPENQKEVGNIVKSSYEDVEQGRDISDKVNNANYVASMDQIHKNDFEQNEAAIREYDKSGVPQDLGAFEGSHAENKIKIHHTNANEINSQERADIDNGKHYQADIHPELYHKSLEKTPFEDSVTKETPTGKTGYDISGSTAFPINEPVKLPDGTEGVKRRAPRNEQELVDAGYADRFLSTNPMVAHHWTQAASVSRQNQITENANSRVKAAVDSGIATLDETGKPSEQFVKGAYEQAVADETRKMVAKRLLDTDRGKLNIKTVNEVKAPRQAQVGSLETYSLQPTSITPQKNLIRKRGSDDATVHTYHMPMNSMSLLDQKGQPLKVSIANMSGINETNGKRFSSSQTIEGAPINGLNFAIGYPSFQGQKWEVNEHNIGADNTPDWKTGAEKTLSVNTIKENLRHGKKPPIIYPWVEVSVPARKNDLSELSSKDREDAERLQELNKLKSSKMTHEQRDEYSGLYVKYNEYIDHNISTDANNVPQLNQYAHKKGFDSVRDMLLSEMTPEQRQTFIGVEKLKDKNTVIAEKELADEKKSGSAKNSGHPKLSSDREKAMSQYNKLTSGDHYYAPNGTLKIKK
jgi:hypothetical protein